MDLINAFPGNTPVNTDQYVTIEEAVFSVFPTDASIAWLDSYHVIYIYSTSMSVPRLYNWQNPFRAVTGYEILIVLAIEAGEKQASPFLLGDSHGKFVVEEELEVDLWRLSVWLEDCIYV
jgi:hypothetical protein